jgi:hypothetical protein
VRLQIDAAVGEVVLGEDGEGLIGEVLDPDGEARGRSEVGEEAEGGDIAEIDGGEGLGEFGVFVDSEGVRGQGLDADDGDGGGDLSDHLVEGIDDAEGSEG